jgi:hypothetical protein
MDNARPEAGGVYAAMDMPWAKLVGQIAHAYGNYSPWNEQVLTAIRRGALRRF